MQPTFTHENGREVCTSDAGKRWRCPNCTCWWAAEIEACWICKAPGPLAGHETESRA
jgi:hypothetical protein